MVIAETLPSGLRLVTEAMPHVRSVTVGVWLTRGSRHESDAESGVAHFVEHMLFKGTTTRSAQEIAQTIDSIGGQLDAFTAKEYASYYIKVLDEHLPIAIDLLSDMVHAARRSRRPTSRKEQSVILEEIKMVEDAPDDLVHEVFAQQFWSRHPLGRPILGTPETVASFSSGGLRDYFEPHVRRAEPDRRRRRASRARARCASWSSGRLPTLPARTPPDVDRAAGGHARAGRAAQGHRAEPHLRRHAGLSAGARRSPRAVRAEHDPRRLDELAAVPAHSRRARAGLRGLQQPHDLQRRRHDHGLRRLRARQGRARSSTSRWPSCASCATTVVPADELRRAKDHLKGSLMLSLESTSSRMSHLARQELYFGRHFTLDEMLAQHRSRDGRRRAARGGRSVPRRRAWSRRSSDPKSGGSLPAERLRI